jgi:hypothetical protein
LIGHDNNTLKRASSRWIWMKDILIIEQRGGKYKRKKRKGNEGEDLDLKRGNREKKRKKRRYRKEKRVTENKFKK